MYCRLTYLHKLSKPPQHEVIWGRTSENCIRNSWLYFIISSGFRRTLSFTRLASCVCTQGDTRCAFTQSQVGRCVVDAKHILWPPQQQKPLDHCSLSSTGSRQRPSKGRKRIGCLASAAWPQGHRPQTDLLGCHCCTHCRSWPDLPSRLSGQGRPHSGEHQNPGRGFSSHKSEPNSFCHTL